MLDDIEVEHVREGDYFGDVEVFGNSHREFTVKSKTACICLVMDKEIVFKDIKEFHANMYLDLSTRAKEKSLKVRTKVDYVSEMVERGKEKYYDDLEGGRRKALIFQTSVQNKEFFSYAISSNLNQKSLMAVESKQKPSIKQETKQKSSKTEEKLLKVLNTNKTIIEDLKKKLSEGKSRPIEFGDNFQ